MESSRLLRGDDSGGTGSQSKRRPPVPTPAQTASLSDLKELDVASDRLVFCVRNRKATSVGSPPPPDLVCTPKMSRKRKSSKTSEPVARPKPVRIPLKDGVSHKHRRVAQPMPGNRVTRGPTPRAQPRTSRHEPTRPLLPSFTTPSEVLFCARQELYAAVRNGSIVGIFATREEAETAIKQQNANVLLGVEAPLECDMDLAAVAPSRYLLKVEPKRGGVRLGNQWISLSKFESAVGATRPDWERWDHCNTCDGWIRTWVRKNKHKNSAAMWYVKLHAMTAAHREAVYMDAEARRSSANRCRECWCGRPGDSGQTCVECEQCHMWVHRQCDAALRRLSRKQIGNDSFHYACPVCADQKSTPKPAGHGMRERLTPGLNATDVSRVEINELPYIAMITAFNSAPRMNPRGIDGVCFDPPSFRESKQPGRGSLPGYSRKELYAYFSSINTSTEALQKVTSAQNSEKNPTARQGRQRLVKAALATVQAAVDEHIGRIDYWRDAEKTKPALVRVRPEDVFTGMENFVKEAKVDPDQIDDELLRRLAQHPFVRLVPPSGAHISVVSLTRGLQPPRRVLSRSAIASALINMRHTATPGSCLTAYVDMAPPGARGRRNQFGISEQVEKLQSTAKMPVAHLLLKTAGRDPLSAIAEQCLRERVARRLLGVSLSGDSEEWVRFACSQSWYHTMWHHDSMSFYADNTRPGTVMTTLYYQLVGKSHWRCTGDMRLGAALGLLQVAYLVAQDPSLVAQCRRLLARAYQQCAISHVELRTREALYVPSWSTHEVLSPGVSCAFAQELWRSYPESGDVGEGCVTWPSGDKRAMRG